MTDKQRTVMLMPWEVTIADFISGQHDWQSERSRHIGSLYAGNELDLNQHNGFIDALIHLAIVGDNLVALNSLLRAFMEYDRSCPYKINEYLLYTAQYGSLRAAKLLMCRIPWAYYYGCEDDERFGVEVDKFMEVLRKWGHPERNKEFEKFFGPFAGGYIDKHTIFESEDEDGDPVMRYSYIGISKSKNDPTPLFIIKKYATDTGDDEIHRDFEQFFKKDDLFYSLWCST